MTLMKSVFVLLALLVVSTRAFTVLPLTRVSSLSKIAASSAFTVPTALNSLEVAEIPSYESKESPKVLGGIKIGLRKLVVVTGASSGLGRECARSLVNSGKYFVIMAVRDVDKGKAVAKKFNFPENSYTVMKLELASLQSVRDFVANLKAFKSARPLTHLVCNAAVYLPKDPKPSWSDDGYEMSMAVNHLGHFLLVNLLLDDMKKAKGARCVIVGSITGNTNTVGGGLVYPKADLGKLKGMESGGKQPIAMMDGKNYDGAKAYKDSKVMNMMTVSELHRRYHKSTGITFSSMYPGCIAETQLFREKRQWFRKIFPLFMKYVTGGYVGEQEAGERLAQVVDDPICSKSGVYWSWNGGAQTVGRYDASGKPKGAGGSGGEIFENQQSDAVQDRDMAMRMFDLSFDLAGISEKEKTKDGPEPDNML